MSLGAKMLCGYLLIWFMVLQNQCVWQMLCHWSEDVMRLHLKKLWFLLYRTILYVTDVMSPKPWCYLACYLSLSSCEFISTSSHMCGSWYLPILLLRDESLTLIKVASLMDLAKFWSSLPTMLKLLKDISWPVVLWWSWMGDGAFMYSLYLSVNVLPDYPNLFFFTVHSAKLISIYQPTFLPDGISPWV